MTEFKVKDYGQRTTFETGSQKEIVSGRGRFDLLPLKTLAGLFATDTETSRILESLYYALVNENIDIKIGHLCDAISTFLEFEPAYRGMMYSWIQDLAKLYEAGANKYAARDWEKGRPMEIFINSALRHYFKFKNSEYDERHDLAFLWNIIGLIDTLRRMPSMAYTLKETVDPPSNLAETLNSVKKIME